jgi:hypothetical protein
MNHEFNVRVTREDGFWVAEVQDVRGGATEARRLSALDGEVRDLLAGLLDLDEDSIELRWDLWPAIGEDALKHLGEYRDARLRYSLARERYEQALHGAAVALREVQVSLRDSADLLEISHQRVHQVLEDA